MNIISHNKPTLAIEDEEALVEVVRSGYIAQGVKVEQFEREFAAFAGLRYAVAVSSGTSALFLALKNYVCKKSDEVIVPSYVCTALLNAVYMAGGTPKIVDIDPVDFNVSKIKIDEAITDSTKAIIIPHIHGIPAVINSNGWQRNIGVIEDCATAVGSRIENQSVGLFGDIAIFSFYATKFITTGQGGMILTNYEEIASKIRDYREFDNPEKYYPRFNFQMTDIQAALGLSQLARINHFLERRRKIAFEYKNICTKKGWEYHHPTNPAITANHYRFIIRLEESSINLLQQHLFNQGIKTIIPIENRELLHNYLSLNKKFYPVSELVSKTTLSLPIYPSLSDKEMATIISALNSY
jgi:dTDP-4-amino-4,6-dideoxygalactose transaminase